MAALSLAPTVSPQYAPIVDSFALPPTSGVVIDAELSSMAASRSVEQPQP
jgi:hypothetical protein